MGFTDQFFLLFCTITLWGIPLFASAQSDTSQVIDADFLFHYYEQDGEHAAVTGGIGTEELRNRAVTVSLLVPLDSLQTLAAQIGTHIYTSASTDRIDSRMSSASRTDFHSSLNLTWNWLQGNQQVGFSVGGAIESDYISTSLGGNGRWVLPKWQSELHLGLQAFFDRWILYFPEELRGFTQPTITTDKRNSFHLEFAYQQIINKRTQAAFLGGITLQQGLLSTPFHRVYFQGENLPRIEYLPEQRIKIPLGLRVHYFASNFLIIRTYYRYYWDDFGIQGHTLSLELPVKLSPQWSVTPLGRYYTQTASTYFAPFQTHAIDASFYTSDFDLSAFSSVKIGLGLRYSPFVRLKGIRQAGKGWLLKTVGLQGMRYQRSDGLSSWAVTLQLSGRW